MKIMIVILSVFMMSNSFSKECFENICKGEDGSKLLSLGFKYKNIRKKSLSRKEDLSKNESVIIGDDGKVCMYRVMYKISDKSLRIIQDTLKRNGIKFFLSEEEKNKILKRSKFFKPVVFEPYNKYTTPLVFDSDSKIIFLFYYFNDECDPRGIIWD